MEKSGGGGGRGANPDGGGAFDGNEPNTFAVPGTVFSEGPAATRDGSEPAAAGTVAAELWRRSLAAKITVVAELLAAFAVAHADKGVSIAVCPVIWEKAGRSLRGPGGCDAA